MAQDTAISIADNTSVSLDCTRRLWHTVNRRESLLRGHFGTLAQPRALSREPLNWAFSPGTVDGTRPSFHRATSLHP